MISSMTSSGVQGDRFLRMAAPDLKGAKMTGPFLRMLLSTMARTSGERLAPSPVFLTSLRMSLPAFIAATISLTLARVSRVKTTPLIRAEGSWSFMPMQDVSWRPIRPSGVVSPNRQPASFSKARGDLGPPLHLRHEVGVEIDGVARRRGRGEEVVEGHHPLDVDRDSAELAGDPATASGGTAPRAAWTSRTASMGRTAIFRSPARIESIIPCMIRPRL